MSRVVGVPFMIGLSWMDNKPVHVLVTRATGVQASVSRRHCGGTIESVPCPAVVSVYYRLMSDVDRHDQTSLRFHNIASQFLWCCLIWSS